MLINNEFQPSVTEYEMNKLMYSSTGNFLFILAHEVCKKHLEYLITSFTKL